jgi:multidrug efflux pump subunit AcrA (membrane-fusion protein)
VIDNQVDPSIGAVRVKAQVANKEGTMIPGQYVSVKLKAKTLKDALVVPTPSVVTNINGDFLYVVKSDNTVDLKPIKILYQYQEKTVVTGINENDKIVVEGKQNLRPGSNIKESKNAEKAQQQ